MLYLMPAHNDDQMEEDFIYDPDLIKAKEKTDNG